ncbi:ATP-dependent DNA helicase [Maritalea sp. S77]|uniref:ATP-dependent DNA helicase n=1 Tax=Maritalea sp. S77 TaxID=3415125 RepID=UPI003C7C76F4
MQWSSQQQEALLAVEKWLADKDAPQIFRLFGWAGTGKSTLAVHLAEGVDKVVFAAFTGKAAMVMRRRGCTDASTIHSLIYRYVDSKDEDDAQGGSPEFKLNRDSEVKKVDLVVIDEVSMVGEGLARDLMSFGKKILVLGDPFQLPPIHDTGFFTDAEPDIMLTEIHRQAADNPIIQLSMAIRNGEQLEHGLYGESKVISKRDVDRDEVLAADQILCGTNATRLTYNDRVRELKHLPAQIPVVGDKLICLRNNHQKKLLNGQLWRIEEMVEKKKGIIKMELSPDDAGDRRTRAKIKTHEKFFEGREDELSWPVKRELDQFYFGYALTVHKAQGSQWDNVYLFDESYAFREDRARHLYTAITRAAERITIVR